MSHEDEFKKTLRSICKNQNRTIGNVIEPVEDLFFKKVLNHDLALIGDETTFDFFVRPEYFAENSVGLGSQPGYLRFKVKEPLDYIGPNPRTRASMIDRANWAPSNEERIIECYPSMSKSQIIEKTMQVFGVDITQFIDGGVNRAILHIVENYSASRR